MTAAPTPVSRLLVWGQALYRLRPFAVNNVNPVQHRLLFAVSDEKQEWLAWYYFSGDRAIDYVLMSGKGGVDHDVVGEFGGKSTQLRAHEPMMVDELAGPIMQSRRGHWKAPKQSGDGFRRATIWTPDHEVSNDSIIHLHMTLMHDTGTYRFPINIKKASGFRGSGFGQDFSERGFLNYIMTEPFQYPSRHLNRRRRLETFHYNLTHS